MSVLLEFLEFVTEGPQPGVQDLLHRVLAKSRKLANAEAGAIFVVRKRGRSVMLDAASIQNDDAPVPDDALRLRVDVQSIAAHVARTGERVKIDNVAVMPDGAAYRHDTAADRVTGFSTRAVLCFPLKSYANEVIGVVQLVNRRGASPAFTSEDAALIQPINHIIGGAVERALMIQRISEQNRRLKERSRLLQRQRRKIAALKDHTEEAFQLSINLLARAAELHDQDTGNHIVRVNEYSYMLAQRLGMASVFCDEIRYSAQLHDVGKMSVNTAVLKKQGRLTPDERKEMNLHPEFGFQILSQSDRLKMAAEIALCHHEKWDGTGYPRGLRGEQIPVSARIVQLADIYDALRSSRPYKAGLSHAQACSIIVDGDDRIEPTGHFDPALVDLFVRSSDEMNGVWHTLHD